MKSLVTLGLLAVAVVVLCNCTTETTALMPISPLSWRYGVGGGGNYAEYLGTDWWTDWDASYNYPPVPPRPPKKVWIVGKFDNRLDGPASGNCTVAKIDEIYAYETAKIADLINGGYTGQYWAIGNEPNWYPKCSASDYVYQFNLYKSYIKGLDPTAIVMSGGISLFSGAGWQAWVSGAKSAGLDPDVWNIHPYDWFDGQAAQRTINAIVAFHSYADSKPIVITEFGKGNWQPEPLPNIVAYLNQVCSWLNENYGTYKIERWFWWGVLDGPAMGSNGLFTDGPYTRDHITIVGDAWFRQSGRVYAGDVLDASRDVGTMKNPYPDVQTAIENEKSGTVIYDFGTGEETVVPIRKAYLPIVSKND